MSTSTRMYASTPVIVNGVGNVYRRDGVMTLRDDELDLGGVRGRWVNFERLNNNEHVMRTYNFPIVKLPFGARLSPACFCDMNCICCATVKKNESSVFISTESNQSSRNWIRTTKHSYLTERCMLHSYCYFSVK